jgi:hypothetical protein
MNWSKWYHLPVKQGDTELQAALEAAERGDFATAYREWVALA